MNWWVVVAAVLGFLAGAFFVIGLGLFLSTRDREALQEWGNWS